MRKPFRFGVVGGNISSKAALTDYARRIEALGYSTFLLPDRLMVEAAPFTTLATVAAVTTALHVGSYVFSNDYRHPALVAREMETLDRLSDGRVEFGLGAGVNTVDHQQLGLPSDRAGVRVARLEEALMLIKRLFSEAQVDFSGKYYTITGLRGLQRPHPPLIVAGAQKRMLQLAGRYADIVAIAFPMSSQQGVPPDASPEEKVSWVREAAGERFDQLELAQTIFPIVITDSSADVVSPPGIPPGPQQRMSTEQAVEHLLELRERYGFSYFHIFVGQMENFAPVVARLNGK